MQRMSKVVEAKAWRDSERRRALIVDEAIRLIGERGYHGFGLQELAERCGVSKPGLLHHFGSKDRLLIAVLEARDIDSELSVPMGAENASGPDAIRAALHAIVTRNVQRPELLRLFVTLRAEAINPAHPAHDYMARTEGAKLDILAMHLAASTPAPRVLARRLVAMISGLEEQWLREGMGFDLVAECDGALAHLLN
jgi:AcrR family transcriptional regulator